MPAPQPLQIHDDTRVAFGWFAKVRPWHSCWCSFYWVRPRLMAPDQCLNVPPRLTQATWHRPPRACKFSKVLKLTPLNAWAFAWAWYASPCPSPGGHPG